MLGHEGKELEHVAAIGLDRLGRHPPLGTEIGQPAHHLGRGVGGGAGRRLVVLGLGHRPVMAPLRYRSVTYSGKRRSASATFSGSPVRVAFITIARNVYCPATPRRSITPCSPNLATAR